MVAEVNRYTATARRINGQWQVQCDQLPGALSLVKRLDQAKDIHREAVAFVAGVPIDQVAVHIHTELPAELEEAIRGRGEAIQRAATAMESARDQSRDVARALHDDQGLSMRDIATILDVSLARVQQLVSEARGARRQRGRPHKDRVTESSQRGAERYAAALEELGSV